MMESNAISALAGAVIKTIEVTMLVAHLRRSEATMTSGSK
jgi:hypothetical protein